MQDTGTYLPSSIVAQAKDLARRKVRILIAPFPHDNSQEPFLVHLVDFANGILERDTTIRRVQVKHSDFVRRKGFEGGLEGLAKYRRGMHSRFEGVHPVVVAVCSTTDGHWPGVPPELT